MVEREKKAIRLKEKLKKYQEIETMGKDREEEKAMT